MEKRHKMPLSAKFVRDLNKACLLAKANREEVTAHVEAMLGSEQVIDYWFWTGPAWGDDVLKLDLYALTGYALYNYFVRTDGTNAASFLHLASLNQITLIRVEDPNSQYVLALDDSARVFAKLRSRPRLAAFARRIIDQRKALEGR